jgi:phosphopantothenoylcysteine decarboxylase
MELTTYHVFKKSIHHAPPACAPPPHAGSVATIKAPLLCRQLCAFADVKVIATSSSRYFVREEQLPEAARPLLGDDDEWRQWKEVRLTSGPALIALPPPLAFLTSHIPPPSHNHTDTHHTHHMQVGDPVMHIELRRWADVLVIAPLSANTLAKAAQGLCDNLLTCVVRAWDFGQPLLVRGLFVRQGGAGGAGRGWGGGCLLAFP